MKRKILFLLLLTFLSLLSAKLVFAEKLAEENIGLADEQTKKLEGRTKILSAYFAKYNSPLEGSAQDFIDAADKYNLDWKLVPAIAGVESTFGKFIPGGYNAWGWGVYGTQAIYFNSWKDAIFTISQGLRENYIDKGYTEPLTMNRIYAASPTWGSRVVYFMQDMEKFENEYKNTLPEFTSLDKNLNTAANSGKLASK